MTLAELEAALEDLESRFNTAKGNIWDTLGTDGLGGGAYGAAGGDLRPSLWDSHYALKELHEDLDSLVLTFKSNAWDKMGELDLKITNLREYAEDIDHGLSTAVVELNSKLTDLASRVSGTIDAIDAMSAGDDLALLHFLFPETKPNPSDEVSYKMVDINNLSWSLITGGTPFGDLFLGPHFGRVDITEPELGAAWDADHPSGPTWEEIKDTLGEESVIAIFFSLDAIIRKRVFANLTNLMIPKGALVEGVSLNLWHQGDITGDEKMTVRCRYQARNHFHVPEDALGMAGAAIDIYLPGIVPTGWTDIWTHDLELTKALDGGYEVLEFSAMDIPPGAEGSGLEVDSSTPLSMYGAPGIKSISPALYLAGFQREEPVEIRVLFEFGSSIGNTIIRSLMLKLTKPADEDSSSYDASKFLLDSLGAVESLSNQNQVDLNQVSQGVKDVVFDMLNGEHGVALITKIVNNHNNNNNNNNGGGN